MTRTIQITLPAEPIERRILLFRDRRVLLDSELAKLYGVPTKRLNEQVRRNLKRFPSDFMFRLTTKEASVLRSQNATSRGVHGGRRYLPRVFTEQGVAMLSSVLNSERAIQVNIVIMRAFVNLREQLSSQHKLSKKLNELESKICTHDDQIRLCFEAIRELMTL